MSDATLLLLAHAAGGSLRSLDLADCHRVTKEGLARLEAHCPALIVEGRGGVITKQGVDKDPPTEGAER